MQRNSGRECRPGGRSELPPECRAWADSRRLVHQRDGREAASGLIALWRVQIRSLQRHADGVRTPSQVADLVLADVHRAAELVDTGLQNFR